MSDIFMPGAAAAWELYASECLPCPCCGADALPAADAPCPVCGWAGGDAAALDAAQRSFRAFGTCEPLWDGRD